MTYAIHITSEQGNTYARTKNGNWCLAYAGLNDYLWAVFETKEEAETAIKYIRTDAWDHARLYIQKI